MWGAIPQRFQEVFDLSVLRIISAIQQFFHQHFITVLRYCRLIFNSVKLSSLPIQLLCQLPPNVLHFIILTSRKKPGCPPSITPPLTTLPLSSYFCLFPSDRVRKTVDSDTQVINFARGKNYTQGGSGGRRRGKVVRHLGSERGC